MIKLYYGSETAKIRQIKKGIIKSCRYPEMDLLIRDSFDEEVAEFTEVVSLLGGNRVVIVELNALTATEPLMRLIKRGTDAQVYIIARTVDSRTQVYKQLKADAVELNKLTRDELHRCIRHDVGTDTLSDECLDYLIDISGYKSDDTVTYDTLCIYIRQLRFLNRQISADDIAMVVQHENPWQIWNLFNFLAQNDMTAFFAEYSRISDNRIGLISAMLRNARLGYKASLCRTARMTEAEISGKLNAPAASFAYSKGVPLDVLCNMIDTLQTAVNAIKAGSDAELITVSAIMRLFALVGNTRSERRRQRL